MRYFIAVSTIALSALFFNLHTAAMGKRERVVKKYLYYKGEERTYWVYAPAPAPTENKSLPLVIALHGGGGRGLGMIRLTQKRFHHLANRNGFLVVYPDGIERHWNDFRDDPIDYAHEKDIDDTGFISALIDKMIRSHKVDSNRVFVTGISNGGFMSFRLACELSHKIRAAAIVAATNPVKASNQCKPSRPVHIAIFNGTDDPLVPYRGGYVQVFKKKRGKILSTDETVSFWVKSNGCAGSPKTVQMPDRDPGDGTTITRISYNTCSNNSRVVLFRINGGGHTWPGGSPYFSERLIGKTSRDINACDEIWKFFSTVR